MENQPFMATNSEDDARRTTLPLITAVTALASDIEATIFLQMSGVWLAKKGFGKIVHENPFLSIVELLGQFRGAGGRLLMCHPCLKKSQIEPVDLIDGAVIVNAPTRIKDVGEAKNVLVY